MKIPSPRGSATRILGPLVAELRERRLWPVVLVLIVGIVAVPVVLAKKPATAPAAPSPSAALPVSIKPSSPPISLSSTPSPVPLNGSLRDPFTLQQGMNAHPSTGPATATIPPPGSGSTAPSSGAGGAGAGIPPSSGGAGGSTPPSGASAGAGTGPAPSSGSAGGGAGAPPSGGATASPATSDSSAAAPSVQYYVYSVDLAFGKVGQAKLHRNVPRLRPFPSGTEPLVVFLGVKDDGKTAVFLVSSQAAPSGNGKCAPSKRACEFLNLRVGQSETLLVLNPDGTVSRYRLKLAAVRLRSSSTPQATQTSRAPAHARRTSGADRSVFAPSGDLSGVADGVRVSVRKVVSARLAAGSNSRP